MVQQLVDGDRDGVSPPADCNDTTASIRPGLVDIADNGVDEDCSGADFVNLDRDGDGVTRPRDCNDANAKIRQGVRDIPRNKIDEDCNGRDARFAVLDSGVSFSFSRSSKTTRFTSVTVAPARKGSKLVVLRGNCPFKAKTVQVRRSQRRLVITLLRGIDFRAGTKLAFRLTHSGTIGRTLEVTIRNGTPSTARRCLEPGAKRPSSCPL